MIPDRRTIWEKPILFVAFILYIITFESLFESVHEIHLYNSTSLAIIYTTTRQLLLCNEMAG